MANDTLKFLITVDNKQGVANLKKFENASLATTAAIGKSFTKLTKTVAIASAAIFGAAAIKGSKDMIRAYGDFEKSLANVSTLVDTSAVDMEKLKKQLLELPSVLGSVKDNTDALYQAISAGVEPAKAVQFVAESAKAAAAGLSDTFTAVEGGTTILNSYGMESGRIVEVFDQMFIAVKAGKTTFEELASSIGKVAPIASATGVTTKELFASIAALTKQGIRTKESVTALKQAFSNIIKPGSKAADAAKELGIQFNAMELKSKGLKVFLADIKKATGGNVETMSNLFGSVEALNAVLALTSDKGAKDFVNILGDMETAGSGVTAEAFGKQSKTFSRSMSTVSTSLEKIGILVGTKVVPPIADMLFKFSEFVDKNKEFITAKIVGVFQLFGEAWQVIKNTFDLLLPVLKPVFKLFETAVEILRGFLRILNGVINALKPFMEFLGKILETIGRVVSATADLVGLGSGAENGRLKGEIKLRAKVLDLQKEYIDNLNDLDRRFKEEDITKEGSKGIHLTKLTPDDLVTETFWGSQKDTLESYMKSVQILRDEFNEVMGEIEHKASKKNYELKFIFKGEGSSILPLGEKITEMGEMFGRLFTEVEDDHSVPFSFEDAAGQALSSAFGYVEDGFSRMFDSIVEGTFNVKTSFKDMAVDILRSVSKMLANKAISELLGLLAGSIGGMLGGGMPYIPALAGGGTATAGRAHIVGERGPELFIPGKTGTVVPNSNMGGGGFNVVNNITVSNEGGGGDPASDKRMAKEVASAIDEQIKRVIASQRRPGGILNPNQAIPRRA